MHLQSGSKTTSVCVQLCSCVCVYPRIFSLKEVIARSGDRVGMLLGMFDQGRDTFSQAF